MTRPVRLTAQGLAVTLVIGLLALLVWRVANDNSKGVAQALKDGSHPTAPAFDLSRLDGRGRLDLASLRGKKPIVLDFWASWCVPCIHESKRLEAARKQYGDRVAFIGVDTKDFSGDARDWQKKHGITYPSVHDGSGSVLA
jgi:cytochrome c biogenesis protein CcmG/thiol:disulfide interchange protein DsbE